MAELPFTPFSEALRDVLRHKYIKEVALWLLGKGENSILAQESNSAWEAALSIIFLIGASDIFAQSNEELRLQETIRYKSMVVARWLLSKKIDVNSDYIYWEKVTWDTSVVIRALLTALKKYEGYFSTTEKQDITQAVVKGTKWLYYRFCQWETEVKYPFGPADVSQIVITLLHLAKEAPELYEKVCQEYPGKHNEVDLTAEIIEYLLHRKTEKTLAIETITGAKEDIIAYWWDDYFSTAEVVEALAMFYERCQSSVKLLEQYKNLLQSLKVALIRACIYFEQGQVEGMWGSHIDTIKVIYAYVIIRRMVHQRESGLSDPLVIPEIHTTFKALRWICDEKQVFSDGSFLHTMFLTIFYALALLEVYRCWEPAKDSIEKIYDDVVWFSPVRTTPERSKRLAAELKNSHLQDELEHARQELKSCREELQMAGRTQAKIVITSFVILIGLPLFLIIGNLTGAFSTSFQLLRADFFFEYLAVLIPVLFALLAIIWKYHTLFPRK